MIVFADKIDGGSNDHVGRSIRRDKDWTRHKPRSTPTAVLAGVVAGLLLVLYRHSGGPTANPQLAQNKSFGAYRELLPIGQHDLYLGVPAPAGIRAPAPVLVPKPQRSSTREQELRDYQDFVVRDTAELRPGDQDWQGFRGPWLSSRWFAHWEAEQRKGTDLGDRVFVPIHWWDCFWGCSDANFGKMRGYLATLDRRYTYFTVAWVDKGLTGKDTGTSVPSDLDLLVFTSGGTTLGARNIWIPLLRAEMQPQALPKDIHASFVGTLDTHAIRQQMHEGWANDSDTLFTDGNFSTCERSNYTLAPRGHGSTSFRMYEALQLGSVPIYFWAYDLALPYTELINWNQMAVVIPQHAIHEMKDRLAAFELEQAQLLIRQYRHLWTYDYVLRYIVRRLQTEVLSPVGLAAWMDRPGRE